MRNEMWQRDTARLQHRSAEHFNAKRTAPDESRLIRLSENRRESFPITRAADALPPSRCAATRAANRQHLPGKPRQCSFYRGVARREPVDAILQPTPLVIVDRRGSPGLDLGANQDGSVRQSGAARETLLGRFFSLFFAGMCRACRTVPASVRFWSPAWW